MMLYPPIILFVSEMLIYILCVDLCKCCGIQLHLFCTVCHLEEGNKRWYQQFPNRVYIFAKMTKGVNFPWMLLLLSVAPCKAYHPRRESLCWMWWGWATPRFQGNDISLGIELWEWVSGCRMGRKAARLWKTFELRHSSYYTMNHTQGGSRQWTQEGINNSENDLDNVLVCSLFTRQSNIMRTVFHVSNLVQ